jgi:hypothetical protein
MRKKEHKVTLQVDSPYYVGTTLLTDDVDEDEEATANGYVLSLLSGTWHGVIKHKQDGTFISATFAHADTSTPSWTFASWVNTECGVLCIIPDSYTDQLPQNEKRHERWYHAIYKAAPRGQMVFMLDGGCVWETGNAGEHPISLDVQNDQVVAFQITALDINRRNDCDESFDSDAKTIELSDAEWEYAMAVG